MPGDVPSGADAGSGGSYLPPVFTHWSKEEAPATEASGDPVAPPFVPGDAAASDVEAAPAAEATPADTDAVDAEAETEVDMDADDETAAFPMDAFIIPEDAERLPAGLDSAPKPARNPLSRKLLRPLPDDRTARLADRLEALARRLRADGPAALGTGLESADRFDVLLSGLLAGYLAAGDD